MQRVNSLHITIATVFSNLLNKHLAVNSEDEALVVEALRRSNNSLNDASLTELGDYLSTLNSEQLKGLANNIKGIFHELKYVEQVNTQDDGISAEIFDSTNHAGADVILKDSETNDVIGEVQLKATDSPSYILEHFKKYPDIEVLATSEIAGRLDGVESTGISNEDITQAVKTEFDQVDDLSTQAQIGDSIATSGLLSAALRASEVMSGKKEIGAAGKDALIDIGIATSTTALVALLFG